MTAEELRSTLADASPPASLPPLAKALWWQARGDWQQAHTIAQDIDTREGAWVHAYLHRCEGDLANAGYWYRQAGRPLSRKGLEEEWSEIVEALLHS